MFRRILISIMAVSIVLAGAGCKPASEYKRKFLLLGTYIEVTVPSSEAATLIYQQCQRLEKVFNIYDPDSEISKVNNSYNKQVKVSGELIEVLQLAKQVYTLSDGLFDVSYGRLYRYWKDLIKGEMPQQLPSPDTIQQLRDLGGMQYIVIDAKQQTITLTKKGLQIDLGAIAKGYIVDKAIGVLRENHVEYALVNAGGDMYCLGQHNGQPWLVGVRDPKNTKDIVKTETLVDEAIATSGNYEQFFTLDGIEYSHIINPKTGYPVQNKVLSVSVVTYNCTSAESLATAFFVMGLQGTQQFLARQPSTMRVTFVMRADDGMQVHILQ